MPIDREIKRETEFTNVQTGVSIGGGGVPQAPLLTYKPRDRDHEVKTEMYTNTQRHFTHLHIKTLLQAHKHKSSQPGSFILVTLTILIYPLTLRAL